MTEVVCSALNKTKLVSSADYVCTILDKFDENIRPKWPGLSKKKVFYYNLDNAPSPLEYISLQKCDLTPLDYNLFPNQKYLRLALQE